MYSITNGVPQGCRKKICRIGMEIYNLLLFPVREMNTCVAFFSCVPTGLETRFAYFIGVLRSCYGFATPFICIFRLFLLPKGIGCDLFTADTFKTSGKEFIQLFEKRLFQCRHAFRVIHHDRIITGNQETQLFDNVPALS